MFSMVKTHSSSRAKNIPNRPYFARDLNVARRQRQALTRMASANAN
jgi:hypothetical protein